LPAESPGANEFIFMVWRRPATWSYAPSSRNLHSSRWSCFQQTTLLAW